MPSNHHDPELGAELAQLLAELAAAADTTVGFPAATDLDATPLAPFLRFMLNNLGDPFDTSPYPMHTRTQERWVLSTVAELLRAPVDGWWGYVTSGASEGTEHGLYLARTMFPTAVVYLSTAAHHTITNAAHRLAMDVVHVRAKPHGEIDYIDLATQIGLRRDRPVIVVGCIGTPLAEGIDDLRRVTTMLDDLVVRRRWIHADAALAGLPLALMPPDQRPGMDFIDGADSIVISGHKFLSCPVPVGIYLMRDSLRPYPHRAPAYTGAADSTLTNSRSGFAVLALYFALRHFTISGLQARAIRSRDLAAYAHRRLSEIGWPASLNPLAFTVVLDTPPPVVRRKWSMPDHHGRSQIICMPTGDPADVDRDRIDRFIADLQAATTLAAPDGNNGADPPIELAPPAPRRRARMVLPAARVCEAEEAAAC